MIDHNIQQFAWSTLKNRRVSIWEVSYGNKINCICLECNGAVGSKNKGKSLGGTLKPGQKAPHFYHLYESNCNGETIIHTLAKEAFLNTKKLVFEIEQIDHRGNHLGFISKLVEFDEVRLEEFVGNNNLRFKPDAIAKIEGQELLVEFAYSSFIDIAKNEKIQNLSMDCIEVDLNVNWIDWSEFKTPKQIYRRLVKYLHEECGKHQIWINNKKYGLRPTWINNKKHGFFWPTITIDRSDEERIEYLKKKVKEIENWLSNIKEEEILQQKVELLCDNLDIPDKESLIKILTWEEADHFLNEDDLYIFENNKLRFKDSSLVILKKFKDEYSSDWFE